ncbi:unnamed protein product [Orchesella dallaii]|uniref:Uncharacterized protein n=1 Tax=Orchesella dallaii TaxID=48710 RepID=A0ABP1Q357_9HEXA
MRCGIGVMRQGRILLEQSPQQLIEKSNSSSLDKAVLQLFKSGLQLSENSRGETCSQYPSTSAQLQSQSSRCPNPCDEKDGYRMATVKNTEAGQLLQTIARIKALTYKNFIVMIRNIFLLSFIIWIPAVELYISNIAFKFSPQSLKLGIINHETNWSVCNSILPTKINCTIKNLSCRYLAAVNPDSIELVHFESAEDAEAAVHFGGVRGYLEFPQEFSHNLYTMATYGASVSESVYNETIVIARFDETIISISIFLKVELYRALEEFLSTVLSSCNLDPRIGMYPLQYGAPIYGNDNMDLREFVLPGVTIA